MSGAAVDVGAVEIQGPPLIHVTAPPSQQFTAAGTVSLGAFTVPGLSGPFLVDVQWGDGTPDTTVKMTSAGTIPSQFHTFAKVGVFNVRVAVTDGVGDLSNSAAFNATVIAAPPINFVVNTTQDQTDPPGSATVSLRDAITRANQAQGPVNIRFSPTVFASPQTLSFTATDSSFGGNPFGAISITGPAAALTLRINSNHALTVEDHAIVALDRLTLTGVSTNPADLNNFGSLSIDHATISSLNGKVFNSGMLLLKDSTLSGTTEGVQNTGICALENCTLTGNNYYAVFNSGQAVIADSTITSNTHYGIDNTSAGTVTLSNSIVAGNLTHDAMGAIHSLGHNLIEARDESTGWIASDLTGTVAHPLDPRLSPLGNYGGPTQTQFPLPASPALGSGAVSLVPAGITTDQRGFSRVVNGKVDIGAFQSQGGAALTLSLPPAQQAIAGVPKSVSLGSFSDAGAAGPFIVTVGWGDGSPANAFTLPNAGSLGTLGHTFINIGPSLCPLP